MPPRWSSGGFVVAVQAYEEATSGAPEEEEDLGCPRFEVPSTLDDLSRLFAQPLSQCESLCREPCLSNLLLFQRELFVEFVVAATLHIVSS